MYSNKIVPINRLKKLILYLKKKGKKIVFTNGCFDILHCGHVSYLSKAKQLGDILIIGINSDSSVKSIKSKKRPINKLKNRMYMLSSLECIDYISSFNQVTPYKLIKQIPFMSNPVRILINWCILLRC